jgi:hypothetical protein
MEPLLFVWLIANTIAAAWFSPHTLWNPVFVAAMRKWGSPSGYKAGMALMAALAVLHGAVAVAVCLLASVEAAVVVTSLLFFGWALLGYFLLQRFAGPLDRTMRVKNYPALYPSAAFAGFISSTLAVIFLADWRCGFVPIVIWLFLGYFCAEVAIRRQMRSFKETGHDADRSDAVFAVNDVQGRRLRSALDRYPFP